MKKKLIITLLSIFLSVGINQVTAQTAPNPPGNGSSGNQSSGGGAPIGGGLFILLGLGAAYGGAKGYKFLKIEKKGDVSI